MSRQTYTTATGYMNGGANSPDVGGVARPRMRHRAAGSLALTIQLDVEALDEQIEREESYDQDERLVGP